MAEEYRIFPVMLLIVPLANLPFDWASIGATRALLRRGAEDDARNPVLLGLLDFAIGCVLLVALALFLLFVLTCADWLAPPHDGEKFLNVPARLDALRDAPWAAGNFWIYVTLFSTLLPSALNLCIGCASCFFAKIPAWYRAILVARINEVKSAARIEAMANATIFLCLPIFLGTFVGCMAVWVVSVGVLHGLSLGLGAFHALAAGFEHWLIRAFGA